MDDNKVYKLLRLIRVADTLLDLDDEAKPTADAMYESLKDDYKWAWPAQEKHLKAWKDDRGGFPEDSEEDETEKQERRKRWEGSPRRKTAEQAEWLRCAILASHSLDYLQRYEATEQRITRDQFGRFFSPESFYEYIWICLNQGLGTRVWKTSPVLPSDTALFARKAVVLVRDAVKRWEHGTDLEKIFPVLTLDDMLPTPADMEASSTVKRELVEAGFEVPPVARPKPQWQGKIKRQKMTNQTND